MARDLLRLSAGRNVDAAGICPLGRGSGEDAEKRSKEADDAVKVETHRHKTCDATRALVSAISLFSIRTSYRAS